MGAGLLYVLASLALTVDWHMVVLARRELAAIFFSPIAYFCLFGFTVIAGWSFIQYVGILFDARGAVVEPIVTIFVLQWWTVIPLLFIVPLLTMRLLSEERRTGSLEMLLTSPVDETPIVLGKFLAGLAFFLLLWIPWALLLVALRVATDQPFDYRPLLSFSIALVCTGGLFVSMGLFFSSLTSNQIVSGVLTFAVMLTLTFLYFVEGKLPDSNAWKVVLTHISYIHLWIRTLDGALEIKYLLFPLSATILFLFMTVKVLDARRWG
jgi:ABC-2 type transport system permease protein